MRLAVASVVVGEQARLFAITRRATRKYADKVSAAHIVLCQTRYNPPHFAKFELMQRLCDEDFDRVLLLDVDIHIRTKAPNIFELYDSAAFSEIPHPRPGSLQASIAWIRDNMDPDWPADCYFNTGVLVMDRTTMTAIVSRFYETGPLPGHFFEQDQLNVLMRRSGYPKQQLPQEWNQFCGKNWWTDIKGDAAHFIHANGIENKDIALQQIIKVYP